jgi:hypothetical protein
MKFLNMIKISHVFFLRGFRVEISEAFEGMLGRDGEWGRLYTY